MQKQLSHESDSRKNTYIKKNNTNCKFYKKYLVSSIKMHFLKVNEAWEGKDVGVLASIYTIERRIATNIAANFSDNLPLH